jgi:iron complex outermembrane receptor protein
MPATSLHRRFIVAVLTLTLSLAAASAFAAQATAVISGTVIDPQAAVIGNAEVVLMRGTTEVRTIRTDARGRYRFDAVAPGTYTVEARANGFQNGQATDIALTAGQGATRDIQLAIAGTTAAVTVEGVGSAERGYRVPAATSLGSLGPASLLDTPYTVSILPADLIANGQVKNFKEATKYLPLVEFQEMQGSEVLRPETRGMQGSNMQNARMDGMGLVVTGPNSMESLQQIEVLNGLGGALYGPANPSGMFNLVPKRPTERPLHRASLDYDGDEVRTFRGDLGGRVGPDRRVGYRVNALAGNGKAFVENSDSERRLFSAAGDVRVLEHTTIDAYVSHYRLEQRGYPGWFTYGRANASSSFILLPGDAPDPTRVGYGQPQAGVDLQSRIGELRVIHDFSRNWHLTVGALDQRVDRDISTQVNTFTDNAGSYRASLASGFAPRFRVFSNLSHLNGVVMTGAVRHEVAIGVAGYDFKTYANVMNPSAASVLLGSASIADPVVFPLPVAGIPTPSHIFRSSSVHQQGASVADNVVLGGGWSVRGAVSQDWIWVDNYNNAFVRTGGYSTKGVSPLVSVMYKPTAWMSIYATSGSSLQQGDVAPGSAVNSGQGLKPYRTTQHEAGYKVSTPTLDVSTAVFRLERPFANLDPADNIFRISGDQVNWGVEGTITGRIGPRLVTYGGLTILDPTLTDTPSAATSGRQFVGIPKYKSNLLTEYRLPLGRATFASLNWQLVGRRPIDDVNSVYTPVHSVVDAGIRYAHSLQQAALTFRLTVNNIGDVHYWSTLGPGNITGTNVGSYTAHLGLPRTVAASMEVTF